MPQSGDVSEGSSSHSSYEDPHSKSRLPVVREVRANMRKAWRHDDQLLAKFFPVDAIPASVYQAVRKELYNEKSQNKRWKRISPTPKPLSRIYTPLTHLLNRILFHCGIGRDKRLFLDTHVRRRDSEEISPSITLTGIGSEFGNSSAQLPRAAYSSSISAFEITLDSDNLTEARDLLAVHVHRIFMNQENRRFAFGLVMTQNTFIVYMFDHAGAVASQPCNYHKNPEQFCAVIAGLAGDMGRISFDTTVVSLSGTTFISTFESRDGDAATEARYAVELLLFQAPYLVGRGTLCWLASLVDDPEQYFVIKDAWIAHSELEGRESEGSLLLHAQAKGVTKGVAQIRHAEDVRCSADPSDFDTILRNRRTEASSPTEQKIERVHTRIVMKTIGKTLDMFSTRRELILAFHDAVLGHRNLHQDAGILHRDISVRNILINVDGAEGDRGILIDFDHAIRVGDTSPYSTKTKIGTKRYMSRNVLDESGPHTYLDDLESFYYVLAWILIAYRGPGIVRSATSDFMVMWDLPGGSTLKTGIILTDHVLPVNSWFGSCCRTLFSQLSCFFRSREELGGKPLSELDPAKDYEEFLGLIQKCISEMEAEDRSATALSQEHTNPDTTAPLGTPKPHAESHSSLGTDDVSPPPAPKRPRPPLLPTKAFPKRRTARYGIPIVSGIPV